LKEKKQICILNFSIKVNIKVKPIFRNRVRRLNLRRRKPTFLTGVWHLKG